MPASYAPRQIVLDAGEQSLLITWADGHVSAYPLDALRRACPCASCVGSHEQMGQIPERELFLLPSLMRWEQVRLEPVGGYGLRFVWDDGHDAGIHTWERLRILCPCAACAPTYGVKG
ncbi:MAG: DUF971 domain-containing protein [Rhodothermales bacterium]|nr:DUF971 domain-containing protein [Rhodothermales bacterium]